MTAPLYALQVDPEGLARVRLDWPPGRPLAELLLHSSAHPVGRTDELLEVSPPEVRAVHEQLVEIEVTARSTCWHRKRAVLRSYPDRVEYWLELEGQGALDRVTLLEAGEVNTKYTNRPTPSGWLRPPRGREGWAGSRAAFGSVFNPSPNAAFHQGFWPGDQTAIHPGNDRTWGGDWFFNPGPFVFGLGDPGRWVMAGLGCRAEEATFFGFEYRGGRFWGLGLSYEGYTRVNGSWRSPTLVLLPTEDEYAGLEAYSDWLTSSGFAPAPPSHGEAWWRQPIWCGWGEQAAQSGDSAPRERCTQQNYGAWLALLAQQGVVPGTVVVDDGWMRQPGLADPHPARWPDLGGFIGASQRAGQRVLLWHNAWEVEQSVAGGARSDLPAPDLITSEGEPARGIFGDPILDPTSPRTERYLRELMIRLLAPPPHGLGADGLKVDITHGTPRGSGYGLAGALWGNALLHRLLSLIYRLAKETRPEVLVEGHAVNPLFRDTCDVVRLNDLHTDLRSVVDMMRHRARVARACGFKLLDCDGWPLPSREALLEYVAAQPELGIPALYYAARVDQSGEDLRAADYRVIADTWQAYRRREGLSHPRLAGGGGA